MNKQIELIPENWESVYEELVADIEYVFGFAICTVGSKYSSGDYGIAILIQPENAGKFYGLRLYVLNSKESHPRLLETFYMGKEIGLDHFRDCMQSATQQYPELEGAILHFKHRGTYPLDGRILYGAPLFD